MKKLLSGIVAIALVAPFAMSSAMAAYEQPWKPLKAWFHVNRPVEVAQYRTGRMGTVDPRTGYREYRGMWVPEQTRMR